MSITHSGGLFGDHARFREKDIKWIDNRCID